MVDKAARDAADIEPVYPVETLLGFILGWGGVSLAIEILGGKLIREGATTLGKGLTGHGLARAAQRGITHKQIEKAIRTAEESGNVVTKVGRYGTPQKVYKGSNGITVVKETSGRNAGKVITIWHH